MVLGQSVAQRDLHLLDAAGTAGSTRAVCRRVGCATPGAEPLGFCWSCEAGYRAQRVTRGHLVATVCARLAAVGDPWFTVFGHRQRAFGAHVVAHLEELEARSCHVPPGAIADYVQELDEARHSA